MIKFINLSKDEPYQIFKNTYDEALKKNQEAIDAVCISSFDINQNQPDARYVNLKYIKGDEWIFLVIMKDQKIINSENAIIFQPHFTGRKLTPK